MAFRVARLTDTSIDDLLGGRYRPGACPHCGHMPDLERDPTMVDDPGSDGTDAVLRLVE